MNSSLSAKDPATKKLGQEGDRIGIFFCGCDADTRWIYEWKKVN